MPKKKKKQSASVEFLEEVGKNFSKKLTKEITKWEKVVYDYLVEFGYNFKFQHPIVLELKKGNKLYILDFLLVDYNLVIEIDGYKYHSTKEQVKSDNIRTKNLKKFGYHVFRIWNSQITNFKKEDIKKIIDQRIEIVKNI
jgi:very-short-patch-repair endonuclease